MEKTVKKKIDYWYYLVIIILALGVYLYFALNISLLVIKPNKNEYILSSQTAPLSLNWPSYGESALSIDNGPILTNGAQTAIPTASTAKLITALLVLKKYPLNLGQSGPEITLTQADVNILNYYQSSQGSVLNIYAGENLSELQMLEAMLLPSANNIADSLAIWAYGSLSNYQTNANQFLAQNNLSSTHVGSDASGFDPSTVSSASDLVQIAKIAYKNPVIANIVGLKSVAGFPLVGSIKNLDFLLGQDGILGIKTGNNNQDMGVFVAVSEKQINAKNTFIYTSVMGAPNLWYAMNSSRLLIESAWNNFSEPISLSNLKLNSSLGTYKVIWNNQEVNATLSSLPNYLIWNGSKASIKVNLNNISFKTKKGQVIGYLTINSDIPSTQKTLNLVLSNSIKKPPLWWLLLHPSYVL